MELPPGVDSIQCTQCGHTISLAWMLGKTPQLAPNLELDDDDDDVFFHKDFDEGYDPNEEEEDEDPGFATLANKALRERVLLTCGSCQTRMKVSKRFVGRKIRCMSCDHTILVPSFDIELGYDDGEFMSMADKDQAYASARQVRLVRAKKIRASQRRRKQLWTLIGGGVVVGIILVVVLLLMGQNGSPPPGTPNQAGTNTDTLRIPDAATPGQNPASTSATQTGRLSVQSGTYHRFASGLWFPARPGWAYCTLRATLQAGNKPLRFANIAPEVTIRLRDAEATQLGSLGEPKRKSLTPLLAKQRHIDISPGGKQKLTFLFEVPNTKLAGELVIAGLPPFSFNITPPARKRTPVVGTYEEMPPRNLKPLLSHPIMKALQSSPPGAIVIEKDPASTGPTRYRVRIAGTGVGGIASPFDKAGVARITLKNTTGQLEAQLALLPDGHTLVLYLAETPMHQLTYRRTQPRRTTGKTAETKPSRRGRRRRQPKNKPVNKTSPPSRGSRPQLFGT